MPKTGQLTCCKCCGASFDDWVHFIDRSDWDGIAYYDPKTKRRPNHVEEIRERVCSQGFWFGRTDIVLVNLPNNKQYIAYPTITGEPEGEAMKWLTSLGKKRARELNRKLLDVCKEHPEMWWKVEGAAHLRPKAFDDEGGIKA